MKPIEVFNNWVFQVSLDPVTKQHWFEFNSEYSFDIKDFKELLIFLLKQEEDLLGLDREPR